MPEIHTTKNGWGIPGNVKLCNVASVRPCTDEITGFCPSALLPAMVRFSTIEAARLRSSTPPNPSTVRLKISGEPVSSMGRSPELPCAACPGLCKSEPASDRDRSLVPEVPERRVDRGQRKTGGGPIGWRSPAGQRTKVTLVHMDTPEIPSPEAHSRAGPCVTRTSRFGRRRHRKLLIRAAAASNSSA